MGCKIRLAVEYGFMVVPHPLCVVPVVYAILSERRQGFRMPHAQKACTDMLDSMGFPGFDSED